MYIIITFIEWREMKLLTLDINLVGTRKKIKRKIQITDDYNLNCLHIAIQELFYFNYDLNHEFEYNEVVYLPAEDHDFNELIGMQKTLKEEMDKLLDKGVDIEHLHNTEKKYKDDCTTKLCDLNLEFGSIVEYTYDIDNQYEITIELVATNPAKASKIEIVDIKGKFVPQGLSVDSYNQLKETKTGEDYEMLTDLESQFEEKLIRDNVSSLMPDTTMYE